MSNSSPPAEAGHVPEQAHLNDVEPILQFQQSIAESDAVRSHDDEVVDVDPNFVDNDGASSELSQATPVPEQTIATNQNTGSLISEDERSSDDEESEEYEDSGEDSDEGSDSENDEFRRLVLDGKSYDDEGGAICSSSSMAPTAKVVGRNPYGISDIASFIDENSGVWKTVPGAEDWAKVRIGGNRKKTWPMNMAIETAFREFEVAGAAVNAKTREILVQTQLTTLLVEVLDIIIKHYDDLASKPQYGYNSRIVAKSRLIRTAKKAAKQAVMAYFDRKTYGERRTDYATMLPRHAKVLACRFVTAHGSVNGYVAGWLAACSQAHLLGVRIHSMGYLTGGTIASAADIAESNEIVAAMARGALNTAVIVQSDVAKLREEMADAGVPLMTQLNIHENAIKQLVSAHKSQDRRILAIQNALETTETRVENLESMVEALAHNHSAPIFDDFCNKFINNIVSDPEKRDKLIEALGLNIEPTPGPSATPTADTTASKPKSARAQVPAKRRATSPASEPQSPPKRRVVPPLITRDRDIWAGQRP